MKHRALAGYAEGTEMVLEAILEAYKSEAYGRIEDRVLADIQTARHNAEKTQGQVHIDQAIAFMQKLDSERTIGRGKADAAMDKIRAVMRTVRVNLAISMKLDEAIERYENAGVDMSAAKAAVSEIMGLIQQRVQPLK